MSGHTKGPWAVTVHDTVNHRWRIVVGPDGRGPIAELKYLATDDAIQEANARLIAAAPDLYQALKILLHDCETEDWDEPDNDLAAARAALARAEGRDQ